MRQPCYNCNDRQLGCHSTCLKYIELRAEYDRLNADRTMRSETNTAVLEITRRGIVNAVGGGTKMRNRYGL